MRLEAKPLVVWEDENAPASVGRTARGLTTQLDEGERRLSMDATEVQDDQLSRCHIGATTYSDSAYQLQARVIFEFESEGKLSPWSWIFTTCGNWCLNSEHMYARTATKIMYPPGVCVYCGFPAGSRDHLLPRHWTGEARRILVAVVPACAECNSRIGDALEMNVTARRRIAHASLRKSKRKLLDVPDRSLKDLGEFGPGLRRFIEDEAVKKHQTIARLAWPDDPFYDIAAFQRSGIEDPISLGLIDSVVPLDADGGPPCESLREATPLRPSDRNLVPFEAIADAVWVDQDDDDCPLCSNPCISDPERTV